MRRERSEPQQLRFFNKLHTDFPLPPSPPSPVRQIRATVSCPNHKAIRLPTMETYIMVSAAPSAAAAAAPYATAGAVTPAPSPLAVGRTAAPTSHVHDMPVSAEQRPQIHMDGPAQQLVSYEDIKHGVRILRNATVRIVSGQRVRAELQQLDSCAVTVFPSLNPDHETIAVLPPGDARPPTAGHRFRTPLDIKTAVGKEGVELIGCVCRQCCGLPAGINWFRFVVECMVGMST